MERYTGRYTAKGLSAEAYLDACVLAIDRALAGIVESEVPEWTEGMTRRAVEVTLLRRCAKPDSRYAVRFRKQMEDGSYTLGELGAMLSAVAERHCELIEKRAAGFSDADFDRALEDLGRIGSFDEWKNRHVER
jgi:hypothetical protein